MSADLRPVPKLADLLADPARVADLPLEAIPQFRAELAKLDTLLQMRVALVGAKGQRQEMPEQDQWLTAKEAAPILGVTRRWLYRHAPKLPFARRVSRKVLRFSEPSLRKWQAAKKVLIL